MPDIPASPRARAAQFCHLYGLRVPIVMAPMAGACPASLAVAVANAGGMCSFGALTSSPEAIAGWAREFRDGSNGGFQINLWTPVPRRGLTLRRKRGCASFSANGAHRCRKGPATRRCRFREAMRCAARGAAACDLVDRGALP
jgi:hypothetical protein